MLSDSVSAGKLFVFRCVHCHCHFLVKTKRLISLERDVRKTWLPGQRLTHSKQQSSFSHRVYQIAVWQAAAITVNRSENSCFIVAFLFISPCFGTNTQQIRVLNSLHGSHSGHNILLFVERLSSCVTGTKNTTPPLTTPPPPPLPPRQLLPPRSAHIVFHCFSVWSAGRGGGGRALIQGVLLTSAGQRWCHCDVNACNCSPGLWSCRGKHSDWQRELRGKREKEAAVVKSGRTRNRKHTFKKGSRFIFCTEVVFSRRGAGLLESRDGCNRGWDRVR